MPREVLKTCYYESLPIKTKDIIFAHQGFCVYEGSYEALPREDVKI